MEFVLPDTPAQSFKIAQHVANLAQNAGTYDVLTSNGNIIVLSVSIYSNTNAAGFTSVSFQTNSVTPLVILSSAAGVLANWTTNKDMPLTYDNMAPFYLQNGGKIQFTIVGVGTLGDALCNVTYAAFADAVLT